MVQGIAKVGTNALCARVLRTRANCFARATGVARANGFARATGVARANCFARATGVARANCFARATGVARANCFARVLRTRVASNEGLRRLADCRND